jgi:Mrp family chromosome partitioning ATPase
VNTQGFETFQALARRSLWLIALLVVLGAVLLNVLHHSQGPEYEAEARVVLSPSDLSQLFSGSSAYVDPDLVDQTEGALARAPQLFQRAATRSGGRFGDGNDLRAATSVHKDGTTISFTATESDAGISVGIANAVAGAYPAWRAEVASSAIQDAIEQLETQLRASGGPRADLLAQLNRLKVLKTLASGNVLLVEPARRADKIRPAVLRDAIIGGLLGLFIAAILIALREAIDTRVRWEEEIEEALEVPVIGSVEALPRRAGLITSGKKGSRFGDMYGLLAANIAQESGPRPTLIAVTSATAREGKTMTASNLAIALARRTERVLLLDLDTRKPSIAKVFRIPADAPGLEQAFHQRIRLAPLMWNVFLNGAGPGVVAKRAIPDLDADGDAVVSASGSLRVLPLKTPIRGGISPHLERLDEILKALSKESDYIVIDTPPALALPDVTELSKFVDQVMVVVRHGRVTRRDLVALYRLHRSWAELKMSAVLVGVPRQDVYSYYER